MKRVVLLSSIVAVAAVTLAAVAREPAISPPPAKVEPGAHLLTVAIQGPSTVAANVPAAYALVARYTDGTAPDVTDQAEWSVDSPYAQVSQGLLTVSALGDSSPIVLTAWYSDGLSLKASLVVSREGADEEVSPEEEGPVNPSPIGNWSPQDSERAGKKEAAAGSTASES